MKRSKTSVKSKRFMNEFIRLQSQAKKMADKDGKLHPDTIKALMATLDDGMVEDFGESV